MSDDFIMSLKVDFAFKELMRNDFVRKGFLSAVLNIKDTDIKSTVLLNTNLPKVHEDEKQGILDVRLTMNDNVEIDIEIQIAYMSAWADRSIFYVSKMLVEQVGINKRYSNIKKCIGISILDFNYITDTNNFHTVYHFREDTEGIKYSDIVEIHIIEMPKLPKVKDNSDLYNWVQFIKAENKEEFRMLSNQNDYLKEAYSTLEEISADEKKRLEYTARQKALYDYNTLMEENLNKGIELGIERGKAERDRELIKKMRENGIAEDMIEKLFNQ